MAETKKIRRAAFVLFMAVSVVLLWYTFRQVKSVFFSGMVWSAAYLALTVAGSAIIAGLLAIGLVLLRATWKEESPFNVKNVKRLKIMSALLILFEPYMRFNDWAINRLYPHSITGGGPVEIYISLGGIVMVTGLVVYCISLVFEYGISLQVQADETL